MSATGRRSIDPRLRRTAETLSGAFGLQAFSTGEARAVGVSPDRLGSLVAAGRLERLRRGYYRMLQQHPANGGRGRAVPPGPARAAAERENYLAIARAIIGTSARAVLVAETAAALHTLPCPRADGSWARTPHVVASVRHRRPPKGTRTLTLGPHARVELIAGLPVTTLQRTAIDVARIRPLPEALIVGDAVARRLVGAGAGRAALLDSRNRARTRAILSEEAALVAGFRGAAGARYLAALVDPAAESPPESLARGYVLQAGIEPPQVGTRVLGASGRAYYADLIWPRHRLIVEIDGRLKYHDAGVLYREKLREDDLREGGFLVVRWPVPDLIANPDWLLARLAELLPARSPHT